MDNRISFQGNFLISNKIKEKHGFKAQMPPYVINKLLKDFSEQTSSSKYSLELVDVDPISKMSYFCLKSNDKALVSCHQTLKSTDLGKLTVDYLVKVYKKLVLNNSYNTEFFKLQSKYVSNNRVRTVIDSNYVWKSEVEYSEAMKNLNAKYDRLISAFDLD